MRPKVIVSGASGLVGRAVCTALREQGFDVDRLVRDRAQAGVLWDPVAGTVDARALEGVRAVVHLAGTNVADHRWSASVKKTIRNSRVEGTLLVARSLAGLERKPEVLVSASAIGWYGDRSDEVLDELSAPGDDFLAHVCRDWEAATAPAADAGIRVVHARIGIVLSAAGGPLAMMLRPFRAGVGGRLGAGRHWMSWIAIEDCVRALLAAIENEDLRDPVNVVSPEPATNAEFTDILGAVLHRPTFMRVPKFALRAVLGEFAKYVVSSRRVLPTRLLRAGFQWRQPDLRGALASLIHHQP